MEEDMTFIQKDTAAWQLLVRIAFYIPLTLTTVGILFVPVELWARGYLLMGLYFCIFSTFSYAKTVRDAHETKKLLNQVNEARTDKLLKEFG